jgi:hypothetical protein
MGRCGGRREQGSSGRIGSESGVSERWTCGSSGAAGMVTGRLSITQTGKVAVRESAGISAGRISAPDSSTGMMGILVAEETLRSLGGKERRGSRRGAISENSDGGSSAPATGNNKFGPQGSGVGSMLRRQNPAWHGQVHELY